MKKIVIMFLVFLLLQTLLAKDINRPKVGLVLSGGGAKGMAHIGALKVLEEAGIKPDYITGTSMGSIVGGLYAIGYTPEEIGEIVTSQNWDDLLMDKISRVNVAMDEKDHMEQYALSFPLVNNKVKLPSGLVSGHNVTNLLSSLTWQAHRIEDFDEFPIPFRCIATDLETGEAVVLKEGYLPDAIRASMSIPSMFNPIEINNQLLVDGGLVRNLPAKDAIEMGADIIIAIDVGTQLSAKDELDSFVSVMNQVINLHGAYSTLDQRKLCDIIIDPKLDEYSIMSFTEVDSIIQKGEQAAREKLPELQELAQKLRTYTTIKKSKTILTEEDPIYISKIYIQGLRNVSRKLVKGKLQLKKNRWISQKKISKAIDRVYGSQYFERVTFKLEPNKGGYNLYIRVVEKDVNSFGFGIHYDDELNAAVHFNFNYRNLLAEGSTSAIDLKFSENPYYGGSYFFHTGWKPGLGLKINTFYQQINIPIYSDSTDNVSGELEFNNYVADLSLQTIISNYLVWGGGITRQHYKVNNAIENENHNVDFQSGVLSFYGFLRVDNMDRKLFTNRGGSLYGEIALFSDAGKFDSEEDFDDYTRIMIKHRKHFAISQKLNLRSKLFFGTTNALTDLPSAYFFVGGNQAPLQEMIPFAGKKIFEEIDRNALVLSLQLRYELYTNIYLAVIANTGKVSNEFKYLQDFDDYFYGSGIKLAALTPIGPLEMQYNSNKTMSLNIGFNFK